MGEGGLVATCLGEGLERRHLDVIWLLRVISPRPTMPDIGTQAGEERFRVLGPLCRVKRGSGLA